MSGVSTPDVSTSFASHLLRAAGTFGAAPLCHSVPSYASLNPYRVIASDEVGDSFPTLIKSTGGVGSTLENAHLDTNSSTKTVGGSYSQAFSDAMYGDDRLMLGLSTGWVIDLTDLYSDDAAAYIAAEESPPSSHAEYRVNASFGISSPQARWTPVRVITVRLHVSGGMMTEFDDLISVYEKGSDLRGDRIFSLRGSDAKASVVTSAYTQTPEYIARHNASIALIADPRLYEIDVFASMATVQFTSRKSSGLHFYASFSYAFECPSGYFWDTVTDPSSPRCRTNRLFFRVDDGIRSAVYAVSAMALAFVVFNIVILLWQWNSLVYKAASRSFMLLILLMLGGMGLGALAYAAIPSVGTRTGHALCAGRAWLTCLPLASILAVLLAKNSRLDAIFGRQKLQVKAITDLQILVVVVIVCMLQCILLAVFTALPLSRAALEIGKGSLSDNLVTLCSQEIGFMDWLGAEIAFIACLMLPAAYLGFKTRDLPSQYNESAHIQNALVILIFFGVIIIPLDIFIQDAPDAAVLIQGLGQALLCLCLTAILFGPKVCLMGGCTLVLRCSVCLSRRV